MATKHRLASSLLVIFFVVLILVFLIFMYPTTFVDTWNGAVGFSWSGNHTLTLYIYAHCYPYYPFSPQCFTRFNVVNTHLVGGSCTLEHVVSTVAWWNNETILTYHCVAKPTAVMIDIICGTVHISKYPIAITNGAEFTPFMC